MSDASGRFVPNLKREDFAVYEDDQPQTITHFSAERVPVSLGIVLDTSGSMAGEKIQSARSALDRFLFDLLDEDDEMFLYRFSDDPAAAAGVDERSQSGLARARAHHAERRDGIVRRGRRSDPARAIGIAAQEGAARDF